MPKVRLFGNQEPKEKVKDLINLSFIKVQDYWLLAMEPLFGHQTIDCINKLMLEIL